MQRHDPQATESVTPLSVAVTDLVEPAEAAFRDAINPAGQWFFQDRQRLQFEVLDSEPYLLAGIKLVLNAGQAALNSAQRYREALERVKLAATVLAESTDLDKPRKSALFARQQEELQTKIERFQTVATTLGGNFDQLLVRYWELHPTPHGRSEEASVWMH